MLTGVSTNCEENDTEEVKAAREKHRRRHGESDEISVKRVYTNSTGECGEFRGFEFRGFHLGFSINRRFNQFISVCYGTVSGSSRGGSFGCGVIETLRRRYANCTIVEGNIEITQVRVLFSNRFNNQSHFR